MKNIFRREPVTEKEPEEEPLYWLVDLQPDTILEREWHDHKGNHFRVAKNGWSWIIRRCRGQQVLGHGYPYETGEAETYARALAGALAAMARYEGDEDGR